MEKIKYELIIDPFTPENTFEVQKLMDDASRDVYLNGGKSIEEVQAKTNDLLSEESIEKVKENFSTLTENEKMLVVKIADRIVGYIYLENGDEKNILQGLFVLPEFQGRGIATKLWEEAKGFLNPKVDTYLDVYSSNTNAINFYKKLGFVETGKTANHRMLPEMEMVLKSV
jgi:ribosomal protein S18 acetylase RimI-like enzyme